MIICCVETLLINNIILSVSIRQYGAFSMLSVTSNFDYLTSVLFILINVIWVKTRPDGVIKHCKCKYLVPSWLYSNNQYILIRKDFHFLLLIISVYEWLCEKLLSLISTTLTWPDTVRQCFKINIYIVTSYGQIVQLQLLSDKPDYWQHVLSAC